MLLSVYKRHVFVFSNQNKVQCGIIYMYVFETRLSCVLFAIHHLFLRSKATIGEYCYDESFSNNYVH